MYRGKTGGLAAFLLSEAETEDPRGTYGLHTELSKRQASRIVNNMSFGYLTSFPAPENTGPDRRAHRLASRFLEGKDMTSQDVDELWGSLTYRLESMKLASEYKGIIGLNLANCNYFLFESWKQNAMAVGGGKAAQGTGEKWLNQESYR